MEWTGEEKTEDRYIFKDIKSCCKAEGNDSSSMSTVNRTGNNHNIVARKTDIRYVNESF